MDAIGLAGLIVAIAAILLTLIIERARKPRIEIVASEWRNQAFVPWTFATVRVKNKELWPVVRWCLERRGAQGCRAEIEYCKWDDTAPFLRIRGRWSSSKEPISLVPASLTTSLPSTGGSPSPVPLTGLPVTGSPPYTPMQPPATGGTAPTMLPGGTTPLAPVPSYVPISTTGGGTPGYTFAYDPSSVPGQQDITADPEGEEIAVAILRNGEVFAFCTESYKYPMWGNPDWKLDLKRIYRVVIRVHGAGVRKERAFRLDCLEADAAKFRLEPIGRSKWWRFWERA